MNKEGGNMTVQDARDVIEEYFDTFSGLARWLKERKKFISENGYTYSFFGRKRRLPNVFSTDKGISSHEVRSGINMEIQSVASDLNILAAIEIAKEFKKRRLDAHIFMLVHDSIVVLCKEEIAEEVKEIMKFYTQKDRGCSISGFPIGVDQDIGRDYSFGTFEEQYEFSNNILSRIRPAEKVETNIKLLLGEEGDVFLLDDDEE